MAQTKNFPHGFSPANVLDIFHLIFPLWMLDAVFSLTAPAGIFNRIKLLVLVCMSNSVSSKNENGSSKVMVSGNGVAIK